MLHFLKDLSSGFIVSTSPTFAGVLPIKKPDDTHLVFSDNTLFEIDRLKQCLVVSKEGNSFVSQDETTIYMGETIKWMILGNMSKYEP